MRSITTSVFSAVVLGGLTFSTLLTVCNARSGPQGYDSAIAIKDYASVGDSYSAGIGAGNKNGEEGDYFCSRYDASFPSQLHRDPRLGDPQNRNFTYLACSGATTDEILANQVGRLGNASQDVITVTAGGNDAHLTEILNECVFQWYSNRTFKHSECPSRMADSQNVIESAELHLRLDKLISILISKLKPDGRLYYVGYAEFFGEEDDQCDEVTWAFFWKYGRREYLKKEKRSKLNQLVRNMNKVLSDAVNRAGDKVSFINYDEHYVDAVGRFCEAKHPETNGNRDGLLFYEWDTDDSKSPTDGSVTTARANPASLCATPDLIMHGTFMGRINELYKQAMADPSLESDVQVVMAHDQSPIDIEAVNASEEQIVRGFSVNVVPDSIGRVFHPRPDGHALIADLVVRQITKDRGASQKEAWLDDEL